MEINLFKSKVFYILYFIIFIPLLGFTQNIPIGTWRTHLSYTHLQTLAIAGDQVYASADNGLFTLDLISGSSTILTQASNFSGTEVNQIAYDPQNKVLLVAYKDGNIDLLKDNVITNIPDLMQSSLLTDKQINHVYFSGNLVYLSCNFGVVVLDIAKQEIKETYQNLGVNGTNIAINASTITNDSIFLATSQGILAAPATGTNLLDFNNWQTFNSTQGIPNKPVTALASRDDYLYAGVTNEGIYVYADGLWQKLNLPFLTQINSIQVSGGQVIICVPGKILILDGNNTYQEISNPLIKNSLSAQYDNKGKLWIADAVNGLISNESGEFRVYNPNGPATNTTWQLLSYEENILALPGGFSNTYTTLKREASFSVFSSSAWENYTHSALEPSRKLPLIHDLISATYNPIEKQLYIGSFGDGLLTVNADGTFQVFNATNSPLQNSTEGNVKITGLATDLYGNTWITSYGVSTNQPFLYVKNADNSWKSYSSSIPATRFPLSILIDDSGYKWMTLAAPQGGIWVFDEKTNKSRHLSTAISQSSLPNNIVLCMVKDHEGQIWIGTERGIGIFLNPFAVFENTVFDAFIPYFENRPLLRDERINCMAIDGGNRKWVGTRNGLWLFSADGSELVAHFTRQNSPLLSDIILDVQIQPATGEVFIATDKGIISYRGTATKGEEKYNQVKVFPNPVHPDFGGMVGISGLVNNANVKITDVTGRLVYETRAQGSTAVWNVTDYTGRKAATGIYLIYSADEEGNETLVSKLAVIE